ncbi:MAG TPA: HD domain-containing protein [Streptosporangiaceae bacterium]|jgi:putative hydrolase of HD superfamily
MTDHDGEQAAGLLPEEAELVLMFDKLKDVERQNPLAYNARRERVGEHSWHLALCVPILAEFATEPIDVARATLIAVVHDLAERFVGDTFAFGSDVVGQHDRERGAMEQLLGSSNSISVKRIVELWNEYEDQKSPEARFVKGLDAFLPILLNSTNIKNSSWADHGVRAEQVQKRLDKVRSSIGDLAAVCDRMISDAKHDGQLR